MKAIKNLEIHRTICLLVALCFLFLWSACAPKEKSTQTITPPPTASAVGGGVEYKTKQNLEAFLPGDDFSAEWKKVSDPYFYSPDNLYVYIDGAAELYFTYDFQRLVSAEYQFQVEHPDSIGDDESQIIVVDIYEMGSPLDGFGIYSNERNPDLPFQKIGGEGYVLDSESIFWKDRYYVKIQSLSEGTDKATLEKFAAYIAAKLPGTESYPAILSLFPQKDIVKNSEMYIGRDLLGHSFLPNGFLVDYRLSGKESKLFLAILDKPTDAMNAYNQLSEFFKTRGAYEGKLDGLGGQAFNGSQPFYEKSIVFQKKNYIGGAIGIPDYESGRKLLDELLGKLE